MARDINTLSDIKYITGAVGRIIAQGDKQINMGQHPHNIDVSVRSASADDPYDHHGHIPYEAFHDAMLELVQAYPAPVAE